MKRSPAKRHAELTCAVCIVCNRATTDASDQIVGVGTPTLEARANTKLILGSQTVATQFPLTFTRADIDLNATTHETIYISDIAQLMSTEPAYAHVTLTAPNLINDELVENEETVGDKSLGEFLQSVTLLTDRDTKEEDEPSVKLMTIHASKGLEFKAVYLVGMEENLFPSQRSMYTVEDLEEERRLFYVAVTRAEKHLTLSFAASRYKYGNINPSDPSRFLKELPEEILDIRGTTSGGQEENPFAKRTHQYRPNTLASNMKKANAPLSLGNEDLVPDSPAKMTEGMDIIHIQFGK